ncbi:MAG TPA: hypothetical protein VFF50_00845 [Candidatus Deferrimicrobiaceae bacterium]|nr:hypothetical protein [Candidatus Deferrimicrobiaceae bacterium]
MNPLTNDLAMVAASWREVQVDAGHNVHERGWQSIVRDIGSSVMFTRLRPFHPTSE